MNVLKRVSCCFPLDSSPYYLYRQSVRSMRLRPPGSRSHYDALGVTPNATQAEIKTAYYKLSKLYHPDRNKGSEIAATHFKTINEAYEILGNFKKRRLYDKGIPTGGVSEPPASEEVDAQTRFYRSRGSTPTGKTPIYDFDEWSRQHYGQSFKRREAAKEKYEKKMRGQVNQSGDIEKEAIIYLSVILVVVASFFHFFNDRTALDTDKTNDKRK